jgi:hypothetical protein
MRIFTTKLGTRARHIAAAVGSTIVQQRFDLLDRDQWMPKSPAGLEQTAFDEPANRFDAEDLGGLVDFECPPWQASGWSLMSFHAGYFSPTHTCALWLETKGIVLNLPVPWVVQIEGQPLASPCESPIIRNLQQLENILLEVEC